MRGDIMASMSQNKLAGNESPLRIRRIEVKGLCGFYDHKIELNAEDRVTILHGPNGVGKTALLTMVNALFSGQLEKVGSLSFESLDVALEPAGGPPSGGDVVLRLTKLSTAGPSENQSFELALQTGGVEKENSKISFGDRNRRSKAYLDRGSMLESLLATIEGTQLSTISENATTLPDWFSLLRERTRTHLIETQRLLQLELNERATGSVRRNWSNSVEKNAEHLSRLISTTTAGFGRDSQALEQTFPQRLLRLGNGSSSLSVEELRDRMTELDRRRDELKRLGLLDRIESHPSHPGELDNLEPTEKSVLTLYVQDTEKKLDILNDLASRIRLFLDFLNRKFRHKQIQIHRDRGFIAVGEGGNELALDRLSSGEQHELVLLHDLLFRIDPDTLVMIDEPEISLHLAWQKRFLPDLLEIVKVAKIDVLIATHSPFIVGDRSDLMVELSDERSS